MKRIQRLAIFLTFASLGFSPPSCTPAGNLLSSISGSYDCIVIKKSPERLNQTSGTGAVTSSSPKDLVVKVISSSDSKISWDFTIHVESASTVSVTTSSLELFSATRLLSQEQASASCFSEQPSNASNRLRMCYENNELSISYIPGLKQEFIFVLDRHVQENAPQLEAPKSYSVTELIELGKNKSFTSQLQFDAAVKSRLDSQTAHMNLLPHLSLNTIAAVASFQMNTVLGIVGDIAPFLIPANWINASAAKWQSEADFYAWLLMRADSANIAQGLSYSILRDRAALASLGTYQAPLEAMLDIVHEKEILGIVTQGSTNQLKSLLNSLSETQNQLKQVVNEESRNLALAVGLVNPDAITDITDDSDSSIENPIAVNKNDLQNLALERSMEVRQIDSLISVAHEGDLGRMLSWATPSASIGLGLPSTIEAGHVLVAEIMTQRTQLQALLLQKVENAADQVAASLRTYTLAKDNTAALRDRFEYLHQAMLKGLAVSVTDLQIAIQDQMKGDSDLINAKYSYLAAAGNLDRMLMTGPYLDISTLIAPTFDPARP